MNRGEQEEMRMNLRLLRDKQLQSFVGVQDVVEVRGSHAVIAKDGLRRLLAKERPLDDHAVLQADGVVVPFGTKCLSGSAPTFVNANKHDKIFFRTNQPCRPGTSHQDCRRDGVELAFAGFSPTAQQRFGVFREAIVPMVLAHYRRRSSRRLSAYEVLGASLSPLLVELAFSGVFLQGAQLQQRRMVCQILSTGIQATLFDPANAGDCACLAQHIVLEAPSRRRHSWGYVLEDGRTLPWALQLRSRSNGQAIFNALCKRNGAVTLSQPTPEEERRYMRFVKNKD